MTLKRYAGILFTFFILLTVARAAFAETGKTALSPEDEKKYELAFDSALAHFEKANILYKKGKTDETVKELEAVIKIDFPDGTEDRDGWKLTLDSYAFLGELWLEKKKPEKAAGVLKEGLKKAPAYSEQTYQLYMTLGHVYKVMDKTDEALAAFESAQKINDKLKKDKEKQGKSKQE
jgi:tetratricopeptide (TPR) repeat protein